MRPEVDEFDLPDPGCGRSSDRLMALFELTCSHPLRAVLAAAGREVDRCPGGAELARSRAYALRRTVERMATDMLDRFGRAFGPRPFTTDAGVSQRWADTHLYLRQHHGERDLAELGRMQWPT